MSNRFPLFARFIAFAFGSLALYLVFWSRSQVDLNTMINQATLAMIGICMMSFSIAFWTKKETVWHYKALFIGFAVFMTAAMWMMCIGSRSYVSVPGSFMFLGIVIGVIMAFAPKKAFLANA